MKTLLRTAQFRRLINLHQVLKEYEIPYEWVLKYSKTEGYVIVLRSDVSSDFKTIALWPLNSDFYPLAKMLKSEMDKL